MEQSFEERVFLGSLVADAFAMPVHWYYNTLALDRDYPQLAECEEYLAPKNPHPDSILWRSVYQPISPDADILHQQAQYWGQHGVHYHQFLAAGQNTVNYQLARELYQQVVDYGEYDAERWLIRYVKMMREPEWHGDTYVEEYHRAFFNRLAGGVKLMKCGIDDKHIGGLSQVPALYAALREAGVTDLKVVRNIIQQHIGLTHQNRGVLQAGHILVRLLDAIRIGQDFETALAQQANDVVSLKRFREWESRADREVIGGFLSPACYIEDSFPAALYLAWKYRDDFIAGVRANALVGGDNCHRGAVVGSLLAALQPIPNQWLDPLLMTSA
ncbi:MAG: ADP-ribosylglycohydrolase family protein [Verrucomicrobiota bacterium]